MDISQRLERQLADAGLQVAVQSSREDAEIVLVGVVDTEEARQAAQDIAAQVAPKARIDNQVEVETVLPSDIDDFAGDEPTAEMADSSVDIAATGGEMEPDFTDQAVIRDPNAAVGDGSDSADDPANDGEVYSPPDDPVLTTDARGRAQVLVCVRLG